MPEDVVHEDVRRAPKNFILAARYPEWGFAFEDGVSRQTWAPECGATDALMWDRFNRNALRLKRFNSWLLRASIKHHIPIMPAVTPAAPLMATATSAGNIALSHAGRLWLTAFKQHYDPGVALV